jgi:cyclopropane fatty-acyl-phospholipid synthase-like methyltransferase
MSDLYTSGGYLENNPDWHDAEAPWKARRIHEFLSSHHVRPSTIAEVGCGAGGVLSNVAQRFGSDVQCVGYDISPQAISLARAKERDGLRYVCGDVRASAERFDLLMMIDVFEHVEDYFGFLRAMRPLADRFVFHIPLELSLWTLFHQRNLLATRKRIGHLHFFWKEQALASLVDAGYDIVANEYSLPLDRWPADMPAQPKVKSRALPLLRAATALAWKLDPDWCARVFGTTSLLVLATPRAR